MGWGSQRALAVETDLIDNDRFAVDGEVVLDALGDGAPGGVGRDVDIGRAIAGLIIVEDVVVQIRASTGRRRRPGLGRA